ncbi:MAG TPA: phosphatase PAP2 family protein [Anaerohalosphaeraceae bacterium]|jgi:membrane-associated phospholipid phosphatase|nr:phosphatase PAP2 family protein [Anaerohalosphaeraceae bacterium]HRT49403.1 phosphatase PAP2 family protein [Anaerohalosphaeraceae bacterium]HRT87396.1 phosphatase PAP2 family protein [Anaerohalosphaeraceae bacterium]
MLSWLKGFGACALVLAALCGGGCRQVEARIERPGEIAAADVVEETSFSLSVSPDAPGGGDSEPGLGAAAGSLAGKIWSLPGLVIEDSREIVTTDNNLFWLLAAAGGSIALRQGGGDDRIWDNFQDNPWVSDHKDLDKFVDYAGCPGIHFAAAGLWYLSSASKGDAVGTRNSWTLFEALAVNGAATLALKLIVNDDTPSGKSLAWPSGHTSSSFTVAAVLDELYGPEVGIPAYLGAGFVGYRMMDSGDHWASDVLFGAVLGYIVGHSVAQKYEAPEVAGFELTPYTDVVGERFVTGVGFVKEF